MTDDIWASDEAKEWVKQVLNGMAPKLADSAVVVQLVPTGMRSEGDVKFWVELGASIMMEKPILAVIFGDAPCPPKLRLIADEFVRIPEGTDLDDCEELHAAMKRLIPELNQ